MNRQLLRTAIAAVFLLGLCGSLGAGARTTDRVRYYIAFDGSGSVAITDKFQNLQHLISELLSRNDTAIRSTASYDLFVFGDDPKKSIHKQFFDLSRVNIGNTRSEAGKLGQYLKQDRGQIYTHMLAALEDIDSSIKAHNHEEVSGGVFLFTDGLLDAGDIDEGLDLKTYKEAIRSLANKISYVMPVFIVQTSPSSYSFLSKDGRGMSEPFLKHSDFFWVNNTVNYSRDSAARQAYGDFLQEANNTIIFRNVKEGDAISAAIMAQRTLNLIEMVGGNYQDEKALDRFLNNPADISLNKVQGAAKSKLISLQLLLNKDQLSDTQVRDIQNLLKHFADYPEELEAVQQAMKNKALAAEAEGLPGAEKPNSLAQANLVLSAMNANAATPTPMDETRKNAGGGSWEQAMILGLTDYIIDRAKFEALYAFFDHIQRFLSDEQCKVIKTALFPNVSQVMEHPERYADMVRVKELFQKDMAMMPANLERHAETLVSSEALVSILAFSQLYESIINTGSLEQAFARLAKTFKKVKFNRDKLQVSRIQKGILFTANIIGYLASHDLTRIKEQPEELEKFSKMIIALAFDAGHVQHINIDSAVDILQDLYEQYRIVNHQIHKLNEFFKTPPQSDFDGYRKYQRDLTLDVLHRSADLMLAGNRILELTQFQGQALDKNEVYEMTRKATQVLEAYFFLKEGKYSRAGVLLASEVANVLEGESKEKLQVLIELTSEVSSANSAAEVKNIIAKFAMPVASYRLKHGNKYNVMVTAYPGLGGIAYIPTDGSPDYRVGISAPLGVEFTIPLGKHNSTDDNKFFRGRKSLSFMVSLIDLGNIINYRLLNEGDSSDIVSFQRIISPGLLAAFAPWQRLPLTFTGGYMINPQRAVLGLSFDLPLLTFSSRLVKHSRSSVKR